MASTAYSFIQDYLYFFDLIMIVLGFIGNTFIFKIYSASNSMRNNTLSRYFRTLSVINQLIMLHYIRIAVTGKYNWDLILASDFTCKTVKYTAMSIRQMAAWLLVMISFDRFLNIRYPRKFKFFYTLAFQSAVIVIIVLGSILMYSPLIWNSQLKVSISTNNVTHQITTVTACKIQSAVIYMWMNVLGSSIVPFILMIFFNTVIIRYISKSRARITAIGQQQNSNAKDKKFALTVLSLNVVFFVLNCPINVYNIVAQYTTIDADTDSFLLFLFRSMYFTFPAIDFYIQITVNSIFREKFFELFHLKITKISAIAFVETLSLQTATRATNQANLSQI
jgi:hypothetical protein